MKIKQIKTEKCTGCGECVADCPSTLFVLDEKTHRAELNDPDNRCIRCGHCVAVCAADAVEYEYEADAHALPRYNTLNYADMLSHMASRRSVRRYKPDPVSREQIEQVLEAIRYSPSASNKRSWSFIVITDQTKLKRLSAKTVGAFKFIRMILNIKPLVSVLMRGGESAEKLKKGVDSVIADSETGVDRILFNAPCCIVLHSPGYAHLSGVDSGIAMTQGALAAHALGLGTCWIGFVMELLFMRPGLRRWLGVPKGEKVWGVLTLGHPDVAYQTVAPRDTLRVRWV